MEPARLELARMVDLLILHAATDPDRCFVLPQEWRLARVDDLDFCFGGSVDQGRSAANQSVFVKRTAGLIVLHIPDEQNGPCGIDDFSQLVWNLPAFIVKHISSPVLFSAAQLFPGPSRNVKSTTWPALIGCASLKLSKRRESVPQK